MKKQAKDDGIFGGSLGKDIAQYKQRTSRARKPTQSSRILSTYTACSAGLLGVLLLAYLVYHPSFAHIWGLPHPLSSTAHERFALDEQKNLTQSLRRARQDAQEAERSYTTILTSGSASGTLLSDIATITTERMNMYEVLTLLEEVSREVVAANTILQRITFHEILINGLTGEIQIGEVRFYTGNQDSVTQSPLGLAASYINILKKSPIVTNVHVEEFAVKTDITKDGPGQQYIPVQLSMQYVFPYERISKPVQWEELQSLLDPLSR